MNRISFDDSPKKFMTLFEESESTRPPTPGSFSIFTRATTPATVISKPIDKFMLGTGWNLPRPPYAEGSITSRSLPQMDPMNSPSWANVQQPAGSVHHALVEKYGRNTADIYLNPAQNGLDKWIIARNRKLINKKEQENVKVVLNEWVRRKQIREERNVWRILNKDIVDISNRLQASTSPYEHFDVAHELAMLKVTLMQSENNADQGEYSKMPSAPIPDEIKAWWLGNCNAVADLEESNAILRTISTRFERVRQIRLNYHQELGIDSIHELPNLLQPPNVDALKRSSIPFVENITNKIQNTNTNSLINTEKRTNFLPPPRQHVNTLILKKHLTHGLLPIPDFDETREAELARCNTKLGFNSYTLQSPTNTPIGPFPIPSIPSKTKAKAKAKAAPKKKDIQPPPVINALSPNWIHPQFYLAQTAGAKAKQGGNKEILDTATKKYKEFSQVEHNRNLNRALLQVPPKDSILSIPPVSAALDSNGGYSNASLPKITSKGGLATSIMGDDMMVSSPSRDRFSGTRLKKVNGSRSTGVVDNNSPTKRLFGDETTASTRMVTARGDSNDSSGHLTKSFINTVNPIMCEGGVPSSGLNTDQGASRSLNPGVAGAVGYYDSSVSSMRKIRDEQFQLFESIRRHLPLNCNSAKTNYDSPPKQTDFYSPTKRSIKQSRDSMGMGVGGLTMDSFVMPDFKLYPEVWMNDSYVPRLIMNPFYDNNAGGKKKKRK